MKSKTKKGDPSTYVALMAIGFGILMGILNNPFPVILPSISVSVEIDSATIGSTIPTYTLIISPILVLVLFYLVGRNLDLKKASLSLIIAENFIGVIIGYIIGPILTTPGITLHLIPPLILSSLLPIFRLSLNLFFIEFTALAISTTRTSSGPENSQANRNQVLKLILIIALLYCFILGFFTSIVFLVWSMGLGMSELMIISFSLALISFLLNPVLIFLIFSKIGKKISHKTKLTSLILSLAIGNFAGYFIGYIIPPLAASLEMTSMLILFIPEYYYPISLLFVQLTALYIPFVKRMKRTPLSEYHESSLLLNSQKESSSTI
ncbi:MAG: hypothetical protein ACFFA1_06875 [Promethearchaeota archaeon]